jgi:hypothetical protein
MLDAGREGRNSKWVVSCDVDTMQSGRLVSIFRRNTVYCLNIHYRRIDMLKMGGSMLL